LTDGKHFNDDETHKSLEMEQDIIKVYQKQMEGGVDVAKVRQIKLMAAGQEASAIYFRA